MTKEEVLAVFERTQGVLSGHFLLTSGRHSDTYMQCAKLFVAPVESERLCAALSKKLAGADADYVVVPAIGGIIIGYELARQLGVKNFFAERVEGKMTLRRGFSLPAGSKVIVAEDVVTTGGSVREVADMVKELGSTVVAIASVVDRSNGAVDFGGARFETLLSVDVKSYEPADCPLCKEGKLPLVKPGSRIVK